MHMIFTKIWSFIYKCSVETRTLKSFVKNFDQRWQHCYRVNNTQCLRILVLILQGHAATWLQLLGAETKENYRGEARRDWCHTTDETILLFISIPQLPQFITSNSCIKWDSICAGFTIEILKNLVAFVKNNVVFRYTWYMNMFCSIMHVIAATLGHLSVL
jgi:hypothetical protein